MSQFSAGDITVYFTEFFFHPAVNSSGKRALSKVSAMAKEVRDMVFSYSFIIMFLGSIQLFSVVQCKMTITFLYTGGNRDQVPSCVEYACPLCVCVGFLHVR